MSGYQENSPKHLKNTRKQVGLTGPRLAPSTGPGETPGVLWCVFLISCWLCQENADENSINYQVRRKKGYFIQAKLWTTTQEGDSQKALRTGLSVRRGRHGHVFFWDKGSYIKMTYLYIVHKVQQGDTVQVHTDKVSSRSSWPPKELGKNLILLRSYIAGVRRMEKMIFTVEEGLPSLRSSG